MRLLKSLLLVLSAILAMPAGEAAETHWVASWASSAMQQPDLLALFGPPPPGIVIPQATIVQGTIRFIYR